MDKAGNKLWSFAGLQGIDGAHWGERRFASKEIGVGTIPGRPRAPFSHPHFMRWASEGAWAEMVG